MNINELLYIKSKACQTEFKLFSQVLSYTRHISKDQKVWRTGWKMAPETNLNKNKRQTFVTRFLKTILTDQEASYVIEEM